MEIFIQQVSSFLTVKRSCTNSKIPDLSSFSFHKTLWPSVAIRLDFARFKTMRFEEKSLVVLEQAGVINSPLPSYRGKGTALSLVLSCCESCSRGAFGMLMPI